MIRRVTYEFTPSSSQGSSNSLVATMPYQYWWPNSCSVTSCGAVSKRGRNQAIEVVNSIGYSMPPPSPIGRSSTTMRGYGYGRMRSP